ncbi:metallo-beta-lactamase superfamily protein [Luteibacter rhizovicinus]|uniref:Metallo-beta-lactamase superfamily protein n=1 Tax=Luteibacter rhizovicinus TaxID=242606 RepID=A0A4R3YMA5_9GAMM|nr:MBL fold metallo-hydrolase [Luteibacter rhizovicinus]TCV93430.1 metallo-beta-lactamase superfamily protein [Luteibacter rhizovicinus]
MSPANESRVPGILLSMFTGAMDSLRPYIAQGKLKTFDTDGEIVPGIHAMATPGHTPGHTTYVVTSNGEKLMAWGDIVHVAAVQLAHPEASIRYDSDDAVAATEREKVFADAARQGYWIAAAHISFPGLGHLRQSSNGFVWVPINYTRTP